MGSSGTTSYETLNLIEESPVVVRSKAYSEPPNPPLQPTPPRGAAELKR